MSIASRIEQIEQHISDDYDVLELAGADLTNVDKNIQNLKQAWEERLLYFLANGTDVVWNNWLPKINGTGETITLNNTIEAKMDFVYKGNTSQTGTPTPDTPIPVQVVSGDNTIKVEGKNLLNPNLIENHYAYNYGNIGGYPTGAPSNARATLSPVNAIKVKPNTTYVFNNSSTTWRFAIAKMKENKDRLGDTGWQTSAPYTITTPENCYYLGFNFAKRDNSNISDAEFNNFLKENLILEENSTATTYEPYQSATYPITLGNIELCKIGTYQDKIYKDNGKWYLNKQIGKVVLDGSENWQNQFGESLFGTNLTDKKINANSLSYCNYFNFHNIQSGLNTNLLNGEYTIQIGTTDTFYCKNTNYSNTTDFKTWLSTHNTIVYYVLATPTTTEITDTTLISQLEAIKKSYNTQTSISQVNNDLPFELDVVALGELS